MSDWKGNYNSLYKTIGATNHTDKEREENDYYATDPIAIDKLVQVERLEHNIWECACGENHLSHRLEELGYKVFKTDIIKRVDDIDMELDFLNYHEYIWDGDIVTNPPYKYAKEFVLNALDLIEPHHKVCMFLKLTFLEGKSRYKELFSKYPPKAIHVFSERVMCAKNGEFEKMKEGGGSAVAFAWFVWEKEYHGKTIVDWI